MSHLTRFVTMTLLLQELWYIYLSKHVHLLEYKTHTHKKYTNILTKKKSNDYNCIYLFYA